VRLLPARVPVAVPLAAVLLSAGVALLGWIQVPERAAQWAFAAFFVPGLWAFVEWRMKSAPFDAAVVDRMAGWHRVILTWAAVLLAFGAATRVAWSVGWIDADTAANLVRLRGLYLGVGLLIWGNHLPKLVSPWDYGEEPFDWQGVHRFCGWVAATGGLVVSAAWLALPISEARPVTMIVTMAVTVLMLGCKLTSLATHAPSTPTTGPS
jgi:hypothetical protein